MYTDDLRVMREHNLYVTFQLKTNFRRDRRKVSFVGHMDNKVGNWLFLSRLFKGVVITVNNVYWFVRREAVVAVKQRRDCARGTPRQRPYIPCDTDWTAVIFDFVSIRDSKLCERSLLSNIGTIKPAHSNHKMALGPASSYFILGF